MELRSKLNITLPFIYLLFLPLTGLAQLSEGGIPYTIKNNLRVETEIFSMPGFDVEELLAEDEVNNQKKDRPYRFGKNFEVGIDNQHHGTWTDLDNGDRIWMTAIESKGAYSINLTFANFHMPKGGKLFIYNEEGDHIAGAFTSANNRDDGLFATDLIKGEKIFLEYYEPRKAKGEGIIDISMVTHAYLDMFNFQKAFGSSGSCNMNVNCPQGTSWQDQKRSVVMLVSGGNGFCSGSLINNALNDGTPYVLTANHCGASGFATWVFRFNWEASGCTNPSSSPTFVSLTGAVSRANSGASDFRLVELTNQIPASYNVYYNGWDNSGSVPTSTVGIHHPSGDIKKISFDYDPSVSTTWGGADVWRVVSWDLNTTTEGGSSGSPLIDQNGRTIGQLFGGGAACGNTLSDFYGRLSTSWNGTSSSTRLKDWLDPNNSGALVLDGFDPNAQNLALDAALIGFVSPASTSNVCADSIYPVITLKNSGSDSLTSLTFYYQINSSTLDSFTWSGLLYFGNMANVNIPAQPLVTGNNTLTVYIGKPNGGTDQNNFNDTLTLTITKIIPTGVPVPYSQNFETIFPPAGWSIENPDGAETWEKDPQRGAYGNSSSSIFVDNFNYDGSGERDGVISRYIDISSGSPLLTFDRAYARYSVSNYDSLIVYISADCGITWEKIYSKGNLALVTNGQNSTTSAFIPTPADWVTDTIDLQPYQVTFPVQFKFENYNGYGNNLYLDNINVTEPNSIEERQNSQLIKLFPNPAGNFFVIRTESAGKLEIYNGIGQLIHNENLKVGDNEILTTEYKAGFYTVIFTTQADRFSEKLIIR